jgi:uncharacterized protein (TIGR00725 family)
MSGRLEWPALPVIAVLGGSLVYTEAQVRAAFRIGLALAQRGKIVVTGATSGVPYAAALGAHAGGGLVVGVSPADSAAMHVRSGRPRFQADMTLYTGMGAEGRSPLILRSVSGAIFIGGEFGTLGEFCSGWLAGGIAMGVLEEHGGIADAIRDLVRTVTSSWGSQTIFSSDPLQLAGEVCARVEQSEQAITTDDEPGADVRRILERMEG